MLLLLISATALAQSLPEPPPPPAEEAPADNSSEESSPVEAEEPPAPPAVESEETAPDNESPPVDEGPAAEAEDERKIPAGVRQLVRIAGLTLTSFAALFANFGISLGLDVVIFGQEFHDQARTFSMLQAIGGTVWATGLVWPVSYILDGNGSFWATSGASVIGGGLSIGAMYLLAAGDPDKLLGYSFFPGLIAFVSGIVAHELTSDPSRRYAEEKATISFGVSPVDNGAVVVGFGTW